MARKMYCTFERRISATHILGMWLKKGIDSYHISWLAEGKGASILSFFLLQVSVDLEGEGLIAPVATISGFSP
jgi:hypothetical protein